MTWKIRIVFVINCAWNIIAFSHQSFNIPWNRLAPSISNEKASNRPKIIPVVMIGSLELESQNPEKFLKIRKPNTMIEGEFSLRIFNKNGYLYWLAY